MFSFLGGFIGDAYGFEYAAVCGALLSILGYTAMSFSQNPWELFVTYIFVGLGGGTMVVASLSTAVVTGRAYAISTVALCVSLSIAFANFLQSSIGDSLCHMGFTDDGTVEGSATCWRTDLRVYAVAISIFACVGLPLMFPAVSSNLARTLLDTCGRAQQQAYSSLATPEPHSAISCDNQQPHDSSAPPTTTGQTENQRSQSSQTALTKQPDNETAAPSAGPQSNSKPIMSPATPLLRAGKALQLAVQDAPSPDLGQPRVQMSSAGLPPLSSRSLSQNTSRESVYQGAAAEQSSPRQPPRRSYSRPGAGFASAPPPYMTRLLTFRQSLVVLKERYFWVLVLADVTAAGVGTYAVTAIPAIVNDVVNPCAVHTSLSTCEDDPDRALYSGRITVGIVLTLFSVLNGVANVSMPLLAGWLHSTGRVHLHRFWVGTMVATAVLLGGMGFLSLKYGTQGSSAAEAPQVLRNAYCIMVAALGFSFGTTLAVFPQIVADGFGSINYGKIFSLVQIGLVGFSVGLPPAANAVATVTGGWAFCHLGMAALLLVSAILLWPQTPRSTGWRTALQTVRPLSAKRPVQVPV